MKLKYLFLLGVLLSLATLSTSTPLSPEPFSSPGFNISTILPRDMPPNRASCGDLSGWWTVAMCPRHAMKVEGPFIAHDSGAALKALLHKKCKTWFTKGITGWDFKYEDEEHMKASIRFGLCGADWCVTNAVWEATGPTGRVRMNGCNADAVKGEDQ
ncbi:hypothetical protein BDZ45DRAFT_691190 [Acephala macrosclerotiorum]|nr:hypothetical protein BDZ45DRAFT_691190 [Acephala macrosclerotiorum]